MENYLKTHMIGEQVKVIPVTEEMKQLTNLLLEVAMTGPEYFTIKGVLSRCNYMNQEQADPNKMRAVLQDITDWIVETSYVKEKLVPIVSQLMKKIEEQEMFIEQNEMAEESKEQDELEYE